MSCYLSFVVRVVSRCKDGVHKRAQDFKHLFREGFRLRGDWRRNRSGASVASLIKGNLADLGSGRYWIDVYAGTGRKWYVRLQPLQRRHIDPISPGARVYITGRRMEALETAAKSHSPTDGGQIIPYAPLNLEGCASTNPRANLSQHWALRRHEEGRPGEACFRHFQEGKTHQSTKYVCVLMGRPRTSSPTLD